MMFHILHHVYSHLHHNNLMHKILHQCFLTEQVLTMNFVPLLINIRINVSKKSTSKRIFFYYFNWCFIWAKIHLYNTPLSYVTEFFNLFNALFLPIPINKYLIVVPFALNIAIFFKNKPSLINHDIYYKHVLQI